MKAFQLKIVIKNSKPPIWRRLVVPAGITFSQLSMILNEAMGWCGYHLFEFEFYHLQLRVIEDADDCGGWDFDTIEASNTYIREYLEDNDWFTYTYDFGDDWKHRVTIERVIDDYEYDYPMVIKYKGNCPIEDCGGIYGYYDCLDIISDENNPEYHEIQEWMYGQGYPNEYDMDSVNMNLKNRYFYKWGRGEKCTQSEIYAKHIEGKFGLQATKKDNNDYNNVNLSGKHSLEESMERFAKQFRDYMGMKQNQAESSLRDIFDDFDKDDIYEMAEEKGVRGIRGLSKDKLIEKTISYMLKPEIIEKYFLSMNDEDIEEFEKALLVKGVYVPNTHKSLFHLFSGGYLGVLSDGSIVIPKEVKEFYNTIKSSDFDKRRKKYNYFLYCLMTAEFLYGIVPIDIFMKLIAVNKDISMTEKEVREEINDIPIEYSHCLMIKDKIYSKELWPDDKGLLLEQQNKDYYIPTLKEIVDIGNNGYLSNGKEMIKLGRFLKNKFELREEEVYFICGMIQSILREEGEFSSIFDILKELELYFDNKKQIEEFLVLLNEVGNNTRMIVNRGFKPVELLKYENFQPIITPKNVMNNKVVPIDVEKRNKVYPNDPCPCGSGKKYKNCCKGK